LVSVSSSFVVVVRNTVRPGLATLVAASCKLGSYKIAFGGLFTENIPFYNCFSAKPVEQCENGVRPVAKSG
jgi:hypothetical protein